jgi:hypothetical protein
MDWRALFKANILNSAEDYIKSNSVRELQISEGHVTADVAGIEKFHVAIDLAEDGTSKMNCNCPYAKTGSNCKHMAAVMLAWESSISSKKEIRTEIHSGEAGETNANVTVNNNQDFKVSQEINIQDSVEMVSEEKKKEIIQRAKSRVELSCEIDDVLTYAIQHNGAHLVRDICVKNISENDIDNLVVRIDSNNELVELFEFGIQKIKPDEELHFKKLKIGINADYLASLTERSISKLKVKVCLEEEVLVSEIKDIAVLAFDQWPGLQYTPELLAAFAMPNHPVVISLLQLASKYLDTWTQEPSLAGYQFKDPNRVKTMAAAAYAAIQQKNITYAEPPSSFEVFGQRIRLADAVLEQHMGTCMDMSLLYVACLEAMGLNPVLIMLKGHIFAGVWLIEESFADMVMDDPSQLEKRMSKGIHELIVVECTAMCAGKTRSFDEAVTLAERHVSDYENFAFAIDVRRARSMGIRPLPIRVKTDAGFEVLHEDRKEKDITSAPEAIGETYNLSYSGEKKQATKQTQWERKLLDISMRNMLINLRMTKAIVPLLSSDAGILEDALADGEEFQVLPRPADMSVSGDGGVPVEALDELGPFADFIALESKHRRLHSLYTEKELGVCLTRMYRSAKTSMEENGANTLYLALGLLRWFEGKKDTAARYAPIVLVPIDINRKSASMGYAMHMRDEDAQINITLFEFLKQNFDTQIYGLNPLPMDEHGLNMPKIFAIVRHAVMNLPMWDVVEVGVIGNFSFSQFVMWNDIHSRTNFLENNKIVRSLMSGSVDWDCTIPDRVDTDEAYLPVTVDSSQLRAINMAAEGVSFVLHGPPGTGKSQTITAMLANALTKGKTVLFVAEKMAALEVVQKRLTALGIQDFCLELHSNKATKKAVLDQLKRGLEIGVWGMQTDYDKKIQDIRMMKADLDAYVKVLHIQRPFGKSLRQLMDIYEMVPVPDQYIRFDHTYACALTESNLDHQIHSLERLIAAGKVIGHPYNHPLAAVHQEEYSQSLKFDLEDIVAAYKTSLEKIQNEVLSFVRWLEIEEPVAEREWKNVCNYARSVIAAEEIPGFLRNADSIDRVFSIPKAYMEKRDAFAAKKAVFMQQWNENFLRMDMTVFREAYDKANKKIFGKGRALDALTIELQAYASFKVETDKIPVYLTDITFYKQEADEVEALESQLQYEWKTLIQEYSTLEALQQYQQMVKTQLQIMHQFSRQIRTLESEGSLDACIQLAKDIITDLDTVKQKEAAAIELLNLVFEADDGNWMENRLNLCHCILDNSSLIKDWIVFRQFAKECRERGLAPVCDAYEAGMPHDQVMNVYLKSIYRAIILSVIENEPVLNGFTGTGFNERISQFKKLDQEFMELTKEEMFYKLTHQLPTGYESVQISKELNILRRAISSNGRGLSIRTLFEQIPHVLTKLCPCMLMSPISVAQYIAAENNLFDIVIFDEASQLPTCKAVGVLARGKNAVIVGDPNQMPPTSFFSGNTVDEDNLDIEDLDSILNDCLALGMPQAHLHWHYRSRHESLIAFSNQEFYENSMLTFPSVNDRERRVSLIKVDGFFDRGKGRVNEGEAKAIVEEIKHRYSDPELNTQTVGVVTFNISQQTLIQDLLQEEYQKDPAFDNWANVGEETLFVKNLENVQGDERDVILFSVAFGPDAEGKLSLNFGPLNKDGGWKRLNVAVSRARMEMVVFTTMTADMINLKRTKSKGVESFKNFLEFAEKGRLIGEYVDTRVQKDQGIMEHICQQITGAGYQYQKAVGHSKFKVDIAVINPYNEEEYLLGIMLDGESYRRSSNTKDREISQISVLESLGWNLHRIWTMDWWDNREKEITRLLQLLEQEKETACAKYQELHKEIQDLKAHLEGSIVEIPNDTQNISGLISVEKENSSTVCEDSVKFVNEGKGVSEVHEVSLINRVETENIEETAEQIQKVVIDIENRFVPKVLMAEAAELKVAAKSGDHQSEITVIDSENQEYKVEDYILADIEVTPISTTDYILKDSMTMITARLQKIIDFEAPIAHDRLVKKTLRSFDIGRSSAQTLEATDKALKKVELKNNKQAGVKVYWRKDQDPDTYRVYRSEINSDEKRLPDEICQQELKNAICVTLCEKGALDKDSLIKETIRTMGYARSGAALVVAVERGLKFGRKTGEIAMDEQKNFILKDFTS